MTLTSRNWIIALASIVAISGCGKSGPADESETPDLPRFEPENAIPKDMKLVPGGIFRMGSDPEEIEKLRPALGLKSSKPLQAEVPSRSIGVADFYMDTFLVNNQQYLEFVREVPAWSKKNLAASEHNGHYLDHWQKEEPSSALNLHPVTYITWHSAKAYCFWKGKRLPTEAEFEWAAQDGKTRAEYPWGEEPPNDGLANWGGDRRRSTSPVGSYPPNERGLYDMAGNVWQFTADPWLGSYKETLASEVTPEEIDADPGFRRVVRGGSWGANAANLRVRYRDSHRALDARETVGFRCAKSVEEY